MNREDFPILKNNIIYFDNAATSLKPKVVIDKIVDYYENYSFNAHRSDYDGAFKVSEEVEQVREKLASFINAENKKEIIFTSGATESLNIVINGYLNKYLKKKEEILITYAEHASVVLPIYNLMKEKNIGLKYIPLNNKYQVDLENLKKVVTKKTKVIILAHVTNTLGDIRPLKEIIDFAHKNNILVVVDASQSIAHLKIDVKNLDADFLVASAHKMLGPTGVGFLYGKNKYLKHTINPITGGNTVVSINSFAEIDYKKIPYKLEPGTLNISGILGFGEAITYLEKISLEQISNYVKELTHYLVSKLNNIPHIEMINKDFETGIISFNIKEIFSQDVAFYLNKYNIYLRAGDHCAKILYNETNIKNSLRISLAFYNTKEEIDKLIMLLSDKEKIINEMI